jgi:hypothetical protein
MGVFLHSKPPVLCVGRGEGVCVVYVCSGELSSDNSHHWPKQLKALFS